MKLEWSANITGLFLDFEGTINDTAKAGLRYAEGVALWLERRLPGQQADWRRAVAAALDAMREFQSRVRPGAAGGPSHEEYHRAELQVWLRTLLLTADVELPAEIQPHDLLRAIQTEVGPEFVPTPGATTALQALHKAGFKLFVTSGADSRYVRACLAEGGVIDLFEDIQGPDSLRLPKQGPEFFQRCLEQAQLRADQICVIDDSAGPISWALGMGARAVAIDLADDVLQRLKTVAGAAALDRLRTVRNFGELPDVLIRLQE